MSPAEFELWVSFREAQTMDHTEARTTLLEDLVRRSDAGDVPRATYLSRRFLAEAHRLDGRWDLVYPLFRECLAEYEVRPWRFGPDERTDFLQWNAWLVECMLDFPDFGLDEIRQAADDVESRFRAVGQGLHEIYSVHRGVAAHLGDWEVAEQAHLRWTATASTADDADDRWLDVAAIDQLLARGDEASVARAHVLAAPMLTDPVVAVEPAVLVRSLMLLPLVKAGEWEQAALAYRRMQRGMTGEFHSLEDHGRVVEFCALTGNESAAIDWLAPMRGFEARKRPLATMEFATSAAVLADVLVRSGRGDTVFDLGDDPNSVPFRVMANRMRRTALDLAERFDRRNGNTVQGDRIRSRLAATPVADFVPLHPTSRRPLVLLPPPGLPDSTLLDRAHWHDLRSEPDEARACLTAVSDDLPEHLAARLAELRAKFFQSDETEPTLRHAAEVCLRYGDERRALLNHCWLGLWIVHSGRTEEGIAVTADAVDRLRVLGDDGDCAWGEHWLAYVLAGQGRHAGAREALWRGRQHAEAAGDLLALGTLLSLESSVHPTGAIGSATAALEAFIDAGVPEKALETVEQLRNAYLELDDHWSFQALVDRLLTDPPADGADRLVGHLRYLRACALIDAGGLADAVDDLNEAIGQAALRDGATVEQWYQLAHANHAAGRHEDAIDSGLRAATWLELLRDKEDSGWSDWVDQSWYLVAESHRALGDAKAALREYRKLADGAGPLAATAFVTGTALLEELGISEWPT